MNKSLAGKIIVNFGDSIFGKARPPEDISTYIAQKLGATVYNAGFGGCRMSEHGLKHFDRFGMYRIANAVTTGDFSLQEESFFYPVTGEALPDYFRPALDVLKSIDFSRVGIATIAYGTNDFTAGQPLEGKDRYDVTSFGGALRYSIETLQKKYPHIQLAICSQTYRFWRDANGVCTADANTRVVAGNKLTDFVAKTKEIAEEYGLFYIDNYNGSGINEKTREDCFSETDGTHPIAHGRHLIADNVSKELLIHFG